MNTIKNGLIKTDLYFCNYNLAIYDYNAIVRHICNI